MTSNSLLAAALLGALAAGAVHAAPPQPKVTALWANATNPPLRVPASDGMEHIEYDLVLTNVFAAPVTLKSIAVVAPDGRVLKRLEGEELKAVTQPVFNGAPTDVVPVAGALAVVMDVAVPAGEIPQWVGHRIHYEIAPDAPARPVIGSLTVESPDLVLDGRAAIVLAPPLRGEGWINASGCCGMNAHRVARLVLGGARFIKPETFAIDWLRMRDGRLFEGDGKRIEQWHAFGAELMAVADGTVVHVRDGMPEETIGKPPANIRATADYAGNNVVIEIRPGVFAVYAHIQPGSIRVKVGDKVRTGQVLGLLGNTGNSSAPHLHFGLQDGPDILTSNSLPYAFDSYRRAGSITEEELDKASEGPSPPAAKPAGPTGAQSGTYPLYREIVDFR